MADNTSTEAAKGGATGRIVRIVGAVVDVEFPADAMPAIYNALTVKAQTPSGEVSTVLEVQTHLPGDIVRTVAMTSTDGMVRGLEATDTGSPIMMPVGQANNGVAMGVQQILQQYKDLQDIIAILGMDELSEDQKLTVNRARKVQKFLGQPFHVAEVFTGLPGVYVKVEDTVRSFKEILDGKCDHIPEQCFVNKGAIEQVYEAYDAMQKEGN